MDVCTWEQRQRKAGLTPRWGCSRLSDLGRERWQWTLSNSRGPMLPWISGSGRLLCSSNFILCFVTVGDRAPSSAVSASNLGWSRREWWAGKWEEPWAPFPLEHTAAPHFEFVAWTWGIGGHSCRFCFWKLSAAVQEWELSWIVVDQSEDCSGGKVLLSASLGPLEEWQLLFPEIWGVPSAVLCGVNLHHLLRKLMHKNSGDWLNVVELLSVSRSAGFTKSRNSLPAESGC